MRARTCLFSICCTTVLLAGCDGTAISPVKGRVTCNGVPVKDASVVFAPIPKSADDHEPGKPGTGFTDAEGNYVLSTFVELDGALLGQHDVMISLDDTNPARCKRMVKTIREVKAGENVLDIELNE